MRRVKYVVFRYLTNADFFNIYKPSGTEERGGGQTYIDFNIGAVTRINWDEFIQNVHDLETVIRSQGPRWTFTINNLGTDQSQSITIYQRREQTFSIAAQRIGSTNSNRVIAWLPDTGFPRPIDPNDRQSKPDSLAIYLVKCFDNSVWAGWFEESLPFYDQQVYERMRIIENSHQINGYAGFLDLRNENIILNTENPRQPFQILTNQQSLTQNITIAPVEEDSLTNEFLTQDIDDSEELEITRIRRIQEVIVRNQKSIRQLKQLYRGECQITGSEFTFIKTNGDLYSEAHHLIPLSEEGADSPYNIIVVSPLIHRMLHYGHVEGLDLNRITEENTLPIMINGENYTIKWNQSHADLVRRHQR